MIKRLFGILLVLVMIGLFTNCYATDGDKYNDGSWRITSTGVLTPVSFSSGAGVMQPFEVTATGDTLTAAETGRTFIVYPATTGTTANFFLPAKANGLNYKLIAGNLVTINVNPNGSDQVKYLTLSAGDSVDSPGTATGESIKLTSDGSYWYVSELVGSWTDAN